MQAVLSVGVTLEIQSPHTQSAKSGRIRSPPLSPLSFFSDDHGATPLSALPTPRMIVEELDRHIPGQDAAKRAVAVALRMLQRGLHGLGVSCQHEVHIINGLSNHIVHRSR